MRMFENFILPQHMVEETEFMPLISVEDEDEENLSDESSIPDTIPVLALKNTVLFPGIVIPITVGRDKSIKAIYDAYNRDRLVSVLSQIDSKIEDPSIDDLYDIGSVAKIVKLLKMPDGTTTAILQGKKRFRLESLISEDPFLKGEIQLLSYTQPEDNLRFEALLSSIKDLAKKIIELSPSIPSEASMMLKNITQHTFLLNFIASNLGVSLEEKQELLEINDLNRKAELILDHMNNELRLLEIKDQIENKVKTDIEKQQRDYFLNQQLKTIQEELGQSPQQMEVDELQAKSKKKKWPKEVKEKFNKELSKLKRTNPQVAEYSVMFNYLELLLDLPWEDVTKDNFDLKDVKKVLDKDHYGLEKVKDRIVEHLAVLKLKGDMKAPILCLVGPPGVGKTSLGRSIGRALKRKFVRMSLGGLHDESEIRGHRKTYIGAMPGRIIQSLRKIKSANPVFILDEIDKVGKDFRGDPSSALLEVLDPEQNSTFYDNYLELEFDLSKVLFVATANNLNGIQPALLDRMEIIRVSGYSTEEKIEIAKRHLIPEQRKEHGLKAKDVKLPKETLERLIQDYTRESGVRSLNRMIAAVMRRVAKNVAMEDAYTKTVRPDHLKDILGPRKYTRDIYEEEHVPGVAVGLAWTSVGGDILFIEVSLSKGKGKLTLTGNLGDVMKESAATALSFIRAHADSLGIDPEVFEKHDIHIHVPEGAIPKDGPSAGITMLTALASRLKNWSVKPYVAMTGEITLRGRVLPVGGIKEKILAAKRAGIKEIILSKENKKDVGEINEEFIKGLDFHYVERMKEVLDIALD